MKRYRLTFEIFLTEKEARSRCDRENAAATAYIRKNKPAHYTPQYKPGTNNTIIDYYIAWYYY